MIRNKALVTPQLLVWARESAHLRPDEAARKIVISEDTLHAWESGEERPTLIQARKASRIYGRPLAVFYLEEVPREFSIVRDFRRVSEDATGGAYSYELMLLIREMQARQAWVKEILKELGAPRLRFVRSVTLDVQISTVSDAIRKRLKLTVEEQCSWRSANHALNRWIDRAEEVGIFVSQTSARGKVLVEDARGFVLADATAPFVFLNSKDTLRGRIFTLAHELAHLWLGESGVSGIDLAGDAHSHEGDIERFCNAVAGAVVFPDSAFSRFFSAISGESQATPMIDRVADQLHVSRDVVARRLLDAGKIAPRTYERLHSQYMREWKSRDDSSSGGGNYYVNHARALGKSFVRLVADVYSRGRITGGEAAGLVQAKLDNMNRLVGAAGTGTTIETV